MARFDHVGVIVADLDGAAAFFLGLGFEQVGRGEVAGETVDKINGLDGVRAEMVWVRTPDGSGTIELVKYREPAETEGPQPSPTNRLGLRHIAIEVNDLDPLVARLRDEGFATVGEVRNYEDIYRLCFVRGPEGLIVELAERLTAEGAS